MKTMKKVFLAVMIGALLLGALPAHATQPTQPWSEEYYRVIDYPSALSEAELENIDENCIEIVSTYQLDVAGLIVTASDYEGMTLQEAGDSAYELAGFGYGASRDGLMIVYDMDAGEMCINCYGIAGDYFTEGYLKSIIGDSLGQLEKRGVWGVMLYPVLCIKKSLEQLTEAGAYAPLAGSDEPQTAEVPGTSAGAETPAETQEETSQPPIETQEETSQPPAGTGAAGGNTGGNAGGSGLPSWYPADPGRFVPFHNDAAPRVVDEADIFTPEEEAVMAEKIRALWDDHQTDIVIYTTKNGYGLEKEELASSFFDYGGYGFGDAHEGACLLFLMDPAARGYRTSVHGDRMRALYTADSSYYMDECLYNHVKTKTTESGEKVPGDYGLGVIEWLGQMDTLFTYGYPAVPGWYTGADIEAFHDSAAPRVTSEIEVLTPEELQELTDRCRKIAGKAGYDVAIHITDDTCQLSMKKYAELFFRHQGYGYGDTYDGMLLLLRHDDARKEYSSYLYVNGNRPESLTEVNDERLRDHVEWKYGFSHASPYGPARLWLGDVEHMVDTGRVMPFTIYWIIVLAGGLFVSFFISLVWMLIEESRMKKPKINETAAAYAVAGTLQVISKGNHFLRTRTERKYSPVTTSSDSSSRSSSSSNNYNSSYKSSSGRTHTTSGRDF